MLEVSCSPVCVMGIKHITLIAYHSLSAKLQQCTQLTYAAAKQGQQPHWQLLIKIRKRDFSLN